MKGVGVEGEGRGRSLLQAVLEESHGEGVCGVCVMCGVCGDCDVRVM